MFNFIITNDGTISVYSDGENFIVAKDNERYEEAKQAIRDQNVELFKEICEFGKQISEYFDDDTNVTVKSGTVYYQGEPVYGVLTDRILQFIKEKLPHQPYICFLDNLSQNPSKRAVDETYTFLEHKNLPITEDGCFLAYKRVRDDWTDFHTGTIDNHVGSIVSMPRNKVCDDKEAGCSYGFHVGSLEYVKNFESGGHIVVCKVNPKDAVSVPLDYNCQKMRVCKYEVIAEYTKELSAPLYQNNGNDWKDEEDNDEIECLDCDENWSDETV